jgi:RNA polymerase sigma-70 factor (ECF subfamily)
VEETAMDRMAEPFIGQKPHLSSAAVPAADLDAALMLQVKEGDGPSFGLLLDKHRNPVINFLFRMVQDRSVAEELAQEVFLRVFRSRESYVPSAKFTTWLFRIAMHLALNWLRDGRKERSQERLDDTTPNSPAMQVVDRKPNVEQSMVYATKLAEVRGAIAQLPEKQRAAVLMHKYEDMEYSQIARVLKCSESAVKSLLFRAYETLRARLSHMV